MPRLKSTSKLAAVVIAAAVSSGLTAGASVAGNVSQLNSALSANHAHEQQVSATLASSQKQISALTGQITLIDSRLDGVQSELGSDQAREQADASQAARERAAARRFQRRLKRDRTGLAHQLVDAYEQGQPSLVDVVLESRSFGQLLDSVNFLGRAEHEEQSLFKRARRDREHADAAAAHAVALRNAESKVAAAKTLQVRSLAGMQTVLDSRQDALVHARDAQSAALAAAHSRGAEISDEIAKAKAQEAAAQRAAAALQASSESATTAPSSTATGGSSSSSTTTDGSDAYGEWAIPASIVMCESGGQNLPPNSAGASGYYQIIPSTWTGFGGTGPAAYLASKQEQDEVAARIWRGGAGAQDWVCAGIVGIS